MHRYIYLHTSDTNMCTQTSKHISQRSLLLLPLSLASNSIKAQELRDLLFGISHFIAPCTMLYPQRAFHQDMLANTVAKVFPNSSDFNSGDDRAVGMRRHIQLIKKNQGS